MYFNWIESFQRENTFIQSKKLLEVLSPLKLSQREVSVGQDRGEKEDGGNRGETEKARREFLSTPSCFVRYSGGWFTFFLFFTLHSNAWWKKRIQALKAVIK